MRGFRTKNRTVLVGFMIPLDLRRYGTNFDHLPELNEKTFSLPSYLLSTV